MSQALQVTTTTIPGGRDWGGNTQILRGLSPGTPQPGVMSLCEDKTPTWLFVASEPSPSYVCLWVINGCSLGSCSSKAVLRIPQGAPWRPRPIRQAWGDGRSSSRVFWIGLTTAWSTGNRAAWGNSGRWSLSRRGRAWPELLALGRGHGRRPAAPVLCPQPHPR